MHGAYKADKTSGGTVTRTVTYYPVAGAMRINGTLYYILKDHLGSASVVTDSTSPNPQTVAEQRYYPYGETRLTATMLTDKLFTGQREMTGLGIYHYGARFRVAPPKRSGAGYSPKLGRFLSADTIVPGAANPQAWNRYAYVLGNPIRYKDPTGHAPECDADGYCTKKISTHTATARLKVRIKSKYGITMSDGGGKNWDLRKLSLMNTSLANIDASLDGNLKSLVGGSTFSMGEHHPDRDHPNSTYGGWTSGSNITFYTTGNAAIRQMNIYHEFGHLLNNMPGSDNVFSNSLNNLDDPSFVTNNGNGILDTGALKSTLVDDLNYGQHVEAIQHECTCSGEQWADIFANYVAGNINLASPQGRDMYRFITGALEPYVRYYP